QVTITATGAPDPLVVNPLSVAVNDNVFTDAGTIVASGNAIIDANDQPGDASSSLSITAVNGSAANVNTNIAGTYGTVHINSDGTYSFTANAAFDQLHAGDNPTESYDITVANSLGESLTTT